MAVCPKLCVPPGSGTLKDWSPSTRCVFFCNCPHAPVLHHLHLLARPTASHPFVADCVSRRVRAAAHARRAARVPRGHRAHAGLSHRAPHAAAGLSRPSSQVPRSSFFGLADSGRDACGAPVASFPPARSRRARRRGAEASGGATPSVHASRGLPSRVSNRVPSVTNQKYTRMAITDLCRS